MLYQATTDAKETANILLKFFNDKNIALDNLVAITCDRERKNTGNKNGIIRNLEIELNKPLQWVVCLLHFNELPFRHLFERLAGHTTGPQTHTGIIPNQIQNCETLQVCIKLFNYNSTYALKYGFVGNKNLKKKRLKRCKTTSKEVKIKKQRCKNLKKAFD